MYIFKFVGVIYICIYILNVFRGKILECVVFICIVLPFKVAAANLRGGP